MRINASLDVQQTSTKTETPRPALSATQQGDVAAGRARVIYPAGSTRSTHFVVDAMIGGEPRTFRNQAGG